MEVAGIGIKQGTISDAAHIDAVLVFILRSSCEPYPIKIDMVGSTGRDADILVIDARASCSGNFQSKQAVVIGTAGQSYWAANVALRFGDNSQNIAGSVAIECRPAG